MFNYTDKNRDKADQVENHAVSTEVSGRNLLVYLLKRWLPVLIGILVVAALIYSLRDCMPVLA